jgi:hypothetical protein
MFSIVFSRDNFEIKRRENNKAIVGKLDNIKKKNYNTHLECNSNILKKSEAFKSERGSLSAARLQQLSHNLLL